MSERRQEGSTSARVRIRSMILVIIAAFCTFGGPYAVYVLTHYLRVEWFVSVASGFGLFAFGVALIGYLAWKKIIV